MSEPKAERPAKPAAKRAAKSVARRSPEPEPEARPAAMRERLREQQRATYREAILEAAARIFAARGFAGVRMSDVAAEAGMATGTLYNYFEDKGEILRSLILAHGNELLRELEGMLTTEQEPLARIERIMQTTFDYIEQHRAGYKMLMDAAPSEGSLQRCGGSEVKDIKARYLALIEAAVTAAVRARRLRSNFPARDLAFFLAGAMDGMARMSVALDDGNRLADKAGMVMELFLSGASTKP